MSDAVIKTLVLLLLIALGLVLKKKFTGKEQLDGIKEMVLSVALPATIFIALMKIELNAGMLFIPLVTLAFNFFIFLAAPILFPIYGIKKDSSAGRTLLLLMPSLAPGLSCFPFILEFIGDEGLAIAAMADIGNKFFVLIFLYIVALNLFVKNNETENTNAAGKLKSLAFNLIKEPINIILFSAIALLSFGINYQTLPTVITGFFDKTSALMTPLVLIFIGLAVKIKQKNKSSILALLLLRAGISIVFSALVISLAGITDPNTVLLILVIPLSSVSFWPFAHISLFDKKENELEKPASQRTFNMEMALMVLAISLPFSTLLILSILSSGTYFVDVFNIVLLGFSLVVSSAIPLFLSKVSKRVLLAKH